MTPIHPGIRYELSCAKPAVWKGPSTFAHCMTLLFSPELESCEPSSTDPTEEVYGTRTKVVYQLCSKEAALTLSHLTCLMQ